MNKSDLAQALAKKDHLSAKNARMVVDMIFEIMAELYRRRFPGHTFGIMLQPRGLML